MEDEGEWEEEEMDLTDEEISQQDCWVRVAATRPLAAAVRGLERLQALQLPALQPSQTLRMLRRPQAPWAPPPPPPPALVLPTFLSRCAPA